MGQRRVSVLFVCMGNICRSPTAEGVFRRLVAEAGLAESVTVDSAGTIDYHAGRPPDARACAAAASRGIVLDDLRAREVVADDFDDFDYILAMDRENLGWLAHMCPEEHRAELRLFLEFGDGFGDEVPDPYLGGPEGFDLVLDMVEAAARGLLDHLRKHAL